MSLLLPVLLLLVVVAVSVSTELESSSLPAFCNGLDCPRYTVLRSTPDYEVRQLDPSVWSSTTVESMDFTQASEEGFHRLFRYISGDNVNQTKVPMAAPVLVDVQPGQGPACDTVFTTNFFVPFAQQEDPPTPSSGSRVSIRKLPQTVFAVRPFSGYIGQYNHSVVPQLLALVQALEKDGVQYDASEPHVAQYDSPFRLLDRHNEVWVSVSE